jgi:replicative DNA helicase
MFPITICNNELPYNYDYGSTPTANLHFTNLTQSGTYYDTIRIAGMCNHILELHLTVNDTTRTDTTYYLCDGETYVDKDFSDITATHDTSYVKRLERANSVGCDSVVYVAVRFGATHNVQDADVILFVHREEVYNQNDPDLQGRAEIIIGKNRSGETGKCDMTFLKRYSRFEVAENIRIEE